VLRAGALPGPVKITEQRTVGPSLGLESTRRGLYASIISLVLVFGFMLVYYRMSGLIACGTLILNIVFVFGMMAAINSTLTLPGIAGLILNVGMAVDANVLIYERIREELGYGKTVRSAIDAGFKRALITIMDSQLTTLITALILLWAGTGPIKGFAITLTFGLIISLFTQITVTRSIFDLIPISKDNKLSI
jgi:preprotein translocase subunit SecD